MLNNNININIDFEEGQYFVEGVRKKPNILFEDEYYDMRRNWCGGFEDPDFESSSSRRTVMVPMDMFEPPEDYYDFGDEFDNN